MPPPADWAVSSIIWAGPGKHLIAGYQLKPSDMQRSLFCLLVAFIGNKLKFDAFQAVQLPCTR
jgi:hypothetical protein